MNDETSSTFLDEIQNQDLRQLVERFGLSRPLSISSSATVSQSGDGNEIVSWQAQGGAIYPFSALCGLDFDIQRHADGSWSIEIYSFDLGDEVESGVDGLYDEIPPLSEVIAAWDAFCELAGVAQESVQHRGVK